MAKRKISAERLRDALAQCDGNRDKTAELLGIAPGYVRILIREYRVAGHTFKHIENRQPAHFKPEYIPPPEQILADMRRIRQQIGLPEMDKLQVARVLGTE